ncbi:hypothetical protein [Arthrobacter sp. ok362]|uniref:hypothetical protein n=1 Tax=Arthrobacter sp. ok362 TaxID=1761745 RepID=UPI00089170AB|nr:hypothetical protein [Arthrobacter sp. ok362]SDM04988.1 hypothetical protein SAMN04487913_12224 [Arthrobacter sp. ok362]
MEDPTTIALNLTFFGTLGVAFFMFLGLFMVLAATLVLAGIGRLAAVVVLAVAGLLRASPAVRENRAPNEPAKAAKPAHPAATKKPRRPARNAGKKEPALTPEWAAAVARADARAAARARAEAVRVTVRDLPNPMAPAGDIKEVSALVQSATDTNGTLGAVPPAFKKPPMPAAKSLLDTGSLVSLRGSLPAGRAKQPAQERKAG